MCSKCSLGITLAGHVSYPTDSPPSTSLRLCNSLPALSTSLDLIDVYIKRHGHILYHGFHPIDPSHKSHNASDKYPTMHHFVTEMCTHAHFCYKMLHCGIRHSTGAFWDLWDCSIVLAHPVIIYGRTSPLLFSTLLMNTKCYCVLSFMGIFLSHLWRFMVTLGWLLLLQQWLMPH